MADLDEILTSLFLPSKDKLECEPNPSFVEMIFTNGLLQPKVGYYQLKFFILLSIKIFLQDWVVGMFVACLWFVFWLTVKGYSYSDILSRSFLPFFMVCWLWHWNYMHQVFCLNSDSSSVLFSNRINFLSRQMASSKRYSDKSKNKDIPASCDPKQLGILESFKLRFDAFWGYPDPCEEYHRVLLTDPSFEVNPFTVLWDMLVVGILHPLGYIGHKIGSFFNEVLSTWHTGILEFHIRIHIICLL